MDIITKLLEIAIEECYQNCVIPWTLDANPPQTWETECTIEPPLRIPGFDGSPDYTVTLCNVLCFIDARRMECWHSSMMD